MTVNEAAIAAVTSLHQLPAPPADFTGRTDDLDALAAALETGGVAIAGLPGMGGVGKTTLALQLAARIAPRYPDAQLYLDLRGTDPDPLTPAQIMAHVIRAWEPAARLPETAAELAPLYRSILHGKRALLLLDNAADRAQVEPLLPPPGVVLLVTSRRHFTLPGMLTRQLDALPPADARDLLLKIAPRIGGHAPAIAELCGCLPLALRLAGSLLAETVDLAPAEYLARLEDARARLDLVDASLSLSHNLLSPDLQRLWCMLSVFPATFDRAAAAAVWALEQDEAGKALGQLLRYSLVTWDAALSRYALHDLVCLFAADRLSACLDEAACQAAHYRHAAHYLAVLRVADDLYLEGGEDILRGLALFDLERANIEVGQAWAAARWQRDAATARLAADFPDAGADCLNLRLHAQEWIAWLQTALAIAREIGDRRREGIHLGGLGNAYVDLGQVEADGDRPGAIEHYTQALTIAREIGDRRNEGVWLGNLGLAYRHLGQVERAIEHYTQALAIAREIGDRRNEGVWLGNLGLAYRHLGQVERAIEHYTQALAIAREIGDRRNEGVWLGNLGLAYRHLGQVERAIEHYTQALAIAREIGDRRGEGAQLGNLGTAYRNLGQTDKARAYLQQALAIFENIKSPYADRAREWLAALDAP